jgi:hypothetical protein
MGTTEYYWERLLREWRKQGRDGFSIPFVIGSQKCLPASHKIQGIGDLIMDIALNQHCSVYILYCNTIQDII